MVFYKSISFFFVNSIEQNKQIKNTTTYLVTKICCVQILKSGTLSIIQNVWLNIDEQFKMCPMLNMNLFEQHHIYTFDVGLV